MRTLRITATLVAAVGTDGGPPPPPRRKKIDLRTAEGVEAVKGEWRTPT